MERAMASDDLVKMNQLSIDTIRTLSTDAVQQANSGHAGTPMAMAPLVYTLCFGEIALLGNRVRTASAHSLTSANVFQKLLEERLGMRPEPADAVGVSNGLAVHITQEGTR
jgi:transketolase-like protein